MKFIKANIAWLHDSNAYIQPIHTFLYLMPTLSCTSRYVNFITRRALGLFDVKLDGKPVTSGWQIYPLEFNKDFLTRYMYM